MQQSDLELWPGLRGVWYCGQKARQVWEVHGARQQKLNPWLPRPLNLAPSTKEEGRVQATFLSEVFIVNPRGLSRSALTTILA